MKMPHKRLLTDWIPGATVMTVVALLPVGIIPGRPTTKASLSCTRPAQ